MSECNGGAFGRNFRDYGSTYSSRSRCDRRSAWGCLASLGLGVPRFARRGGCLASLGTGDASHAFIVLGSNFPLYSRVPVYTKLVLYIAIRVCSHKIYGFRNDCSGIRSVKIAIYILQYSIARNLCKQAKIRVRLYHIFPPHTPYTKTLRVTAHSLTLSPRTQVRPEKVRCPTRPEFTVSVMIAHASAVRSGAIKHFCRTSQDP
jgi:hypothetical protein